MNVVFDHREQLARNIYSFYFKPESKVDYTPGQYIEMNLPHNNPDKRGDSRWFTLSSSPNDKLLSITTRIFDKPSTFKATLFELKKDQAVVLSNPQGDFVLPKLIQTPLIFVAGGIGITPFHSIVAWLAAQKEKRNIRFIYAVESEEDIVFLDTFAEYKQHISIVVNHPTSAWGGERGYLTAELILGLANPGPDSLIYVSGPEPMVEVIEKDLIKNKIDKRQLVLDFFPNYKTI